jgi:hypothetical protein
MALSNKDASIVLGMTSRGDPEHDIAAYFGVNQGRISEINGGSYGSISAAPADQLPPKGSPGPKGRRLKAYALDALAALKDKGEAGLAEAIKELEEGIHRFDANET